jgi:hypothetical protein
MSYETPSKCKKQCARKPSYCADEKEFPDGKMSKAEDITQDVLRRAGYEKKKENQEGPLVMKEIIITFDRFLAYKFIDKRTSKRL